MYIVKKLITAFILPPGVFILAMLVAGTLFMAFKRRATGIFMVFLGMLMWGLSITPVTDLLLMGLIRDLQQKTIPPEGDVVVLLGGGVDDRLTDLSGEPGILPEPMVDRVVTAARLAARLKVPVIVSGGRAPGRQVTEAEVARRYMLDLGVSSAAIIEESSSRDTRENAENVRKICSRLGFTRPILVTSAWHLKRALWVFKKAGLTCVPFSNGLASIRERDYPWEYYLPSSSEAAAIYFREYIGMAYYRLVY